jgi:hypothetical protein
MCAQALLDASLLLGSLFQVRISNLQKASITEQKMRVNMLESDVLANSWELTVDKAILNSV